MRKLPILLIALLLISGLTIRPGSAAGPPGTEGKTLAGLLAAEELEVSDPETRMFLTGKAQIFNKRWSDAREKLKQYLEKYPSGRYRAEALYWLGLTLDRLSRDVTDSGRMIELKEEAVGVLEDLIEQHPESFWTDDAATLKAEIYAILALMGKKKSEDIIRKMAEDREKENIDLKIIGLNALLDIEPEAAIPLLMQIIKKEEDPSVRKKGVMMLGRHFSDAALNILKKSAKEDPDKDVRKEAAFWAALIEMHRLPVYLNFYFFGARVKNDDYFKENIVNEFDLPRSALRNSKKAEETIKSRFGRKISGVKHQTSVYGIIHTHGLPYCAIHDIRVKVIIDDQERTEDQITGKVQFFDHETGKIYLPSFTIDSAKEKLFVVRRGNKAALLMLQFESAGDLDSEGDE